MRRSPETGGAPIPEQAATERIELVAPEKRAAAPAAAAEATPAATPVATGNPAPAVRAIPPLQRSVEAVLEEGLEDLYHELKPAEQQLFKARGEATASHITELIQKVSVKVSEILKLVRQWLLAIPGINRYYLEQAAKIKADKILKLH